MDPWKVAEILYDEFGEQEFTTNQITPKTMTKLIRAMGIPKMPKTAARQRNARVGRAMGQMEGKAYYIFDHETQVEMRVSRPVKGNGTRRFRLAPPEVINLDEIPFSIGPLSRLQIPETGLTFQVVLVYSPDYQSYGVFCPALGRCTSQGRSKEEALENVKESITGWLKGEALDIQQDTETLLKDYGAVGCLTELAAVNIG